MLNHDLHLPATPRAAVPEPAAPGAFAANVVLRHLQSPAEIARVLHLREEIDLSVHAAAGPQFFALEKKETSAGWCSDSSSTVRWSAPSGSCRWATA